MSGSEVTDFAEPVLETIERSGLDLAQCIVHGGSVLALHGLRAAKDLDVFAHPSYFWTLAESGQTSNGMLVAEAPTIVPSRKALHSAEEPAEDCLPIEIGSYGSTGLRRQLLFNFHLWQAEALGTRFGILHIISLEEHRKLIATSRQPKHQQDVELIDAYLQKYQDRT